MTREEPSEVSRLGQRYLGNLLDSDPRVLHFPLVMTSAAVQQTNSLKGAMSHSHLACIGFINFVGHEL